MELENGSPNGSAQLYKNGIIQLSWTMKQGVRDGSLTVYNDGVVEKITTWSSIEKSSNSVREVVNDVNGKVILIEKSTKTGITIYRGGFDKNLNYDGFGIEYDEKDGFEKHCGFYKSGELIHITQLFERVDREETENTQESKDIHSKPLMIEFGGEKDDENVLNCINRRPTYIGEYQYNDEKGLFFRHGYGKMINEVTGLCDVIGEWSNGYEIKDKSYNLHCGWYGEQTDGIETLRELVAIKDEKEIQEEITICPQLQIQKSRGLEELVISYNSFNVIFEHPEKVAFTVKDMPRLRQIKIESNSLQQVRNFIVEGLERLECVKVGDNCFRINQHWNWKNERADGLCKIKNCPRLRDVILGNDSFCDFKTFELCEVDALQSIDFGKECFHHSSQCILKSNNISLYAYQ